MGFDRVIHIAKASLNYPSARKGPYKAKRALVNIRLRM